MIRSFSESFELFRTLGGLGAELVGLHAHGQGEPKGISFPIKDGNVIEEVRYQPPTDIGGARTPRVPSSAPSPKTSGSPEERMTGASSATRGARVLPGTKVGRVWINPWQYIEGVPESAWTFPIGGYLPAQRWLKDRIGRTLGFTEQEEYMRLVWALMETRRLMAEIDATIKEHGGWPLK